MANQEILNVSVELELESKVYETLQRLAAFKGVTVGQFLSGMVRDDVERIAGRINDPIGIFDAGEPDVSARDEDYLQGWKPD
jgi:hypothetical protein